MLSLAMNEIVTNPTKNSATAPKCLFFIVVRFSFTLLLIVVSQFHRRKSTTFLGTKREKRLKYRAAPNWKRLNLLPFVVTARNEAVQTISYLSGLLRRSSSQRRKARRYSLGPAATSALPASFVVNFSKFLMKREERSLAFSSQAFLSA